MPHVGKPLPASASSRVGKQEPPVEAILTPVVTMWRTILWALIVLLTVLPVAAADLVLLEDGRTAVGWNDWRRDHVPVALLVWASWAPTADAVLAGLAELESAAGERGLRLAVLAVQEPVEDSRAALAGRNVDWLHDRHGALLKELRVIRVPALVVVEAGGGVGDRLEPTAAALRSWRSP